MIKLRFRLLGLLGILCAQFSASAAFEAPLCEPDFDYVVEEGTYYFENLTDCEDGTYCWYVDGELYVIAPVFEWTPSEPGEYEICLNVLTSTCSNWYCEDLTVSEEDCAPCHIEITTHSCGDCLYVLSVEADFDAEVSWLISDGTLTTGSIIMHTFEEAGTYTICATATGEACPDGVSECFTIVADCGDEPDCDGGSILAQQIEPCYANFSIQDLDGVTGVDWFVNGLYWGESSVLPYFSYDDEEVTIEAIAYTEGCPDGVALSLEYFAEGCGGGCEEDYWLFAEYVSDCEVHLFVDGSDTEDLTINWYVDDEFVATIPELAIINEGDGANSYDVWVEIYHPDCPEPFFLTEFVQLAPCEEDCGEEYWIESWYETECQTLLSLQGTDLTEIDFQWYVNGENAGNGLELDIYNDSNEWQFYEVEVVVYHPDCETPYEAFYFVEIPPCAGPCDQNVYIEWFFETECEAFFFVVEELPGEVTYEWYVAGELYSTEQGLYLGNTYDYTLGYDVELIVYSNECDYTYSDQVTLEIPPCSNACDDYYIAYECWPGGNAVEFFIEGLDEAYVVGWYVNGSDWLTANTLTLDIDPFNPTYEITAFVETADCPLGIELSLIATPTECIEFCDYTYGLVAEEIDDCTTELFIVGTSDWFEAEWWVNGESIGWGQSQVLEAIDEEVTTYWVEALVFTEWCPDGIWLTWEGVVGPCNQECIGFGVEVLIAYVPTEESSYWPVVIEDEFGNVVAEDVIEIAPGWEIGGLDFCLPEGCYTAEVFYPTTETYPIIIDINLIGVSQENVAYTSYSDVMQFGLGEVDCGYDTGITEPMVALEAWPNPVAGGPLTLELTGEVELLVIRDLSGRVMHQINRPNQREVIQTDAFASGMYTVIVQGPSGSTSRKVLVQR